jgi:hypothetical protein
MSDPIDAPLRDARIFLVSLIPVVYSDTSAKFTASMEDQRTPSIVLTPTASGTQGRASHGWKT